MLTKVVHNRQQMTPAISRTMATRNKTVSSFHLQIISRKKKMNEANWKQFMNKTCTYFFNIEKIVSI